MSSSVQLRHFDNMVLFKGSPVFSGLLPSQLKRLVYKCTEEKFSPGSVILESGVVANSLYIIKDGECSIGEKVFSKGDTIFEAAIFTTEYISKGELIADERVTLVSITKKDMYDLLLNNPETTVSLLERFASKIVEK